MDAVTVVKEFESRDSYALWMPQPSYSSVNSSSQKDAELHVVFRTRQTDGILFFAASFSRLEHAILEVVLGFHDISVLAVDLLTLLACNHSWTSREN